MKEHFRIAILMTIVTTIVFGLAYPLAVTGLAQLFFPVKANGEQIEKQGKVIGSRLIGQGFSAPGYFYPRPSEAGNGYDGLSSGSSNLGPTNQKLISQVKQNAQALQAENLSMQVPVDMVTASGSGLDPDITPAAAEFQIPRVARERHMAEEELRALVRKDTEKRQFGILGEPRVNVLELNLELDAMHPMTSPATARGASASLSPPRSDNPPKAQ